jgi:hypothetical protein
MKPIASLAAFVAAPLFAMTSSAVFAQDWKVNVAPSVTNGSYSDSSVRQHYLERGAILTANYQDQGGWALGLSRTTIAMKNALPDTEQSNLVLSGHWNFQAKSLPGRWTARLDLHGVTNNDQSNVTDRVSVWAPQLSWQSTDGTVYLDTGLARSRYQSDLTVNQITPTLGFAFNDKYDWLQLRSYQISGMNPVLAAGKTSTSALEAKWTHYLVPSASAYKPVSFSVGLMGGERIYAVDMDAQSVANLPDLHTGTFNLGATWKLAPTARLFVLLGQNRFHSSTSDTDYRLNVAHATLSFDF